MSCWKNSSGVHTWFSPAQVGQPLSLGPPGQKETRDGESPPEATGTLEERRVGTAGSQEGSLNCVFPHTGYWLTETPLHHAIPPGHILWILWEGAFNIKEMWSSQRGQEAAVKLRPENRLIRRGEGSVPGRTMCAKALW